MIAKAGGDRRVVEIVVAPRLQGLGISRAMLTALRDDARRHGFTELYAPIRPTEKQERAFVREERYRRRSRRLEPGPTSRSNRITWSMSSPTCGSAIRSTWAGSSCVVIPEIDICQAAQLNLAA